MSQMDIKKAVGFLLAGAAVGAGVTLLYAPQSGTRTKRDIRKFARKTVDRLDDIQTNIREQVTDWVDDMAESVKDGIDRGKKLGTQGYEQVLQSFDGMKESVDIGKARVEEMIRKETA